MKDLVFTCSPVGRVTRWKFTANEKSGPTHFVADWGFGTDKAFAKLDQGESWTLKHSYEEEGKYKVTLLVGDGENIDHEHTMCIQIMSDECDPERPIDECDDAVDEPGVHFSTSESSATTVVGHTVTTLLGVSAMMAAFY